FLLFRYSLMRPPPISPLFPYTTLFRSRVRYPLCQTPFRHPPSGEALASVRRLGALGCPLLLDQKVHHPQHLIHATGRRRIHEIRSEEHTSELQSRENLVCRLLLEKKKR